MAFDDENDDRFPLLFEFDLRLLGTIRLVGLESAGRVMVLVMELCFSWRWTGDILASWKNDFVILFDGVMVFFCNCAKDLIFKDRSNLL